MKSKIFNDPQNPKYIHHLYQTGDGAVEHKITVSAAECEKQSLKTLNRWRKITWLDRLYYKLTGKVR